MRAEITKLSNLLTNGFIKTINSDGTLNIDLNTYALSSSIGNGTLTMSGGTHLIGTATFTANQSGNTSFNITIDATNLNTVSTIVARDASGNFSAGSISATTFTGALTGNATTASSAAILTTPRNISISGGSTGTATSFNGSTDITIPITSLAASYLTGIIPASVLSGSSLYVGTTQILLNRPSGSLALTGVSIDGSAGSVTNSVTFNTSGGASGGTTYNGSTARTIDYSTIGAAPLSGSTYYVPYTGANKSINLGSNNLTVDTNSLFVNASNHRVGIGTSIPACNFVVNQPTTDIGTVTTNGTVTLTGVGTQFNNTFVAGDDIYVSGETIRTIATVDTDTSLTVGVAFSTSSVGHTYTLDGGSRLSVLGNGNVGIGRNITPEFPFEIRVDKGGYVTNTATTGVSLWNRFGTSTGAGEYGIESGKFYFQAMSNLNGIYFTNAAFDKGLFVRETDGYTGINTLSPASTLDVNGIISISGTTLFTTPLVSGSAGTVGYVLTSAGSTSTPTWTSPTGLTAGSLINSVTFNNAGAGSTSPITFDGSTARTISYNTLGAVPTGRTITINGSTSDLSTNRSWSVGTVTSVTGTTSQGVSFSVANSTTAANITLSLGALTNITSLNGLVVTANTGVITTGTWNAGVINSTYGGTGINNAGRTLTVNTNSGTLDYTLASKTLTIADTGSIKGTNTGDQTITLSGDVTTSAMTNGTYAATLATVASAGTYNTVIVNAKGLVTSGTTYSYSLSTHVHYQLYQPNGSNPFVYTDNSGTLHIDGNIVQSGSSYNIHAQDVYTTGNTITLRDGAIAGLSGGQYVGFTAKLYDGANDGQLVFDNTGTARVGDIGSLQPISTRIESPSDGYIAYWENANTRLNFKQLTTTDITNIGSWSGSTNIVTVGTITTGTWHGTVLESTYGGTGINNAGRTLTISTNSGTLLFSGAGTTLTIGAAASVAGSNTGDVTLATNHGLSLTNQVIGMGTPSYINGTSTNSVTTTTHTHALSGVTNTQLVNSSITIGTTAIALGASSTTLAGLTAVSATTFTGALTGNATTASSAAILTTARNISVNGALTSTGITFNGSADVIIPVSAVGASYLTGTIPAAVLSASTVYIGTTAILLNRGTGAQSLTGVNIDGSAGSATTAGSVTNAITFNTTGGASAGTTYNGSVARTIDYSSVGASPLAGSSSLVTVGGITTGTWSGSTINSTYGGTGINNAGRTLTISTNSGTLLFSGASSTLTIGANASISNSNTGDQTTISGNAGSATYASAVTIIDDSTNANMNLTWVTTNTGNLPLKVTSAKLYFNPSSGALSATSLVKIGGTSSQFLKADGSVDSSTYITSSAIGNGTLTLAVSGTGLSGSQTFTANQAGNGTFTVTSNATSANTASTIVARDGSGGFSGGTVNVTELDISSSKYTYQENLVVNSGAARVVAQVLISSYTCAFFDYVIKNGVNLRAGNVTAVHNGTIAEFTEYGTNDLGNTSGVVLTVDVSGGYLRLLATTTTDAWIIKTIIRGI